MRPVPRTSPSTGVVSLAGVDNDFEIVSRFTGTTYNGIDIRFDEAPGTKDVVADWHVGWGTNGVLEVDYDPDVATVAQLVDAIAAIQTPQSCPLEVRLIDPTAGFTGLAYDGEVEDYMFDIVRYRSDWGDAPSDPISGNYLYPTLAQLNGASHLIVGPYLGAQPDAEMNGQPTLNASGDDLSNDDEDGVTFLDVDLSPSMTLVPGNDESRIEINLRGADTAMLEGWIDFNGDGIWADDHARSIDIDPAGMHDEFYFIAPGSRPGGNTSRRRLPHGRPTHP